MNSPPAPPTGRRDRLLEAAIELLCEGGFEAVTIRSVAARAGVNSALISYYFGSKRELLVESASAASMRAFAEPAEMVLSAADPVEGIRSAIDWLAGTGGEDPQLRVAAETMVRAMREPDLREAIAAGVAMLRQEIAQRLAGDAESGTSRRALDPAGFSLVLTALFDGLLLHRLLDPELDLVAATATLTAMVEPDGEQA
jgi:AcrR family transcriptional regulator